MQYNSHFMNKLPSCLNFLLSDQLPPSVELSGTKATALKC